MVSSCPGDHDARCSVRTTAQPWEWAPPALQPVSLVTLSLDVGDGGDAAWG